MRQILLAFACLILLTTAGRAEVRLDLSNKSSYTKTRKEMAAQVVGQERINLEYALLALEKDALSDLGITAIELSGARHRTLVFSNTFYGWLATRLDGKTAAETIETARDHLAATNAWKIDRDLKILKFEFVALHAGLNADFLRLQIDRGKYPESRVQLEKMLDRAERSHEFAIKSAARFKNTPALEGSYMQHERWRETDYIAIEVAGRHYQVPGHLLYSVTRRGALDNLTGFTLQVPWQEVGLPPVESRSKDDTAPYMRVRLRDLTGFLGPDSHERFVEYADRYHRNTDENVSGLVAYRSDDYMSTQEGLRLYSTYYLDETDGYRAPQGTPLVFRCEDLGSAAQERRGMAVSCSTTYWLEDRMLLEYAFSRANLSQWRAVDVALRNLLESFSNR